MINKLKEFYLFYYLPIIAIKDNVISEDERRWTTLKDIVHLPNGLVNDPNFYKSLPCKRDYVVAMYQNFDLTVKELRHSDFESLAGQHWLTGFLISVLFNILNVDPYIQVIEELISTKIFEDSAYSDYFIGNVSLTKRKLVLPCIVNGNHFCLALVNFDENTFSFLDPMGSTTVKNNYYLKKFENFIFRYNEYHNKNYNFKNMKIFFHKHLIQKDNFNCGPLITYFFHQIINLKPANEPCDLAKYRIQLKDLLLKEASNMKNICLFCARQCEDSLQCVSCLRYMHQNCAKIDEHSCIKFKICDICRQY